MGIVTNTYQFVDVDETVTKTKLNNLAGPLVTEFNGNISDDNIASDASIQASKIDFSSPGVIGGTTPAAGTFTDLTSTGDTTIGNAALDGFTINPSAWTLANAVTITGTWADLGAVTTIDINGGTINDVVADLTSLDIGTSGVVITSIENNDSLGTSDVKLCTQGNVKAYVDSNAFVPSSAAGTLTVSSTGSVAISGLGFTPKSVIFIGGYKDATDVKPGFSYGIWDGTNMYSLATTFVSGDTSGKGGIVDNTFRIIDSAGTEVEFSGTSLDTDGFTVNVTTADSNYYVRYLAQG